MQIVIDIKDELYVILKRYKEKDEYLDLCERAIVNGTPLPKGYWYHKGVIEAWDIAGQKTFAEKRECSCCNFQTNFIEGHGLYSYCPNCGAKMEDKNEDSN